MVLTDRQRSELHSGIYEYLISQSGASFKRAAEALAIADPSIKSAIGNSPTRASPKKVLVESTAPSSFSNVPVLERKWTAVTKLQQRVLELEKLLESRENRPVVSSDGGLLLSITTAPLLDIHTEKRFLPRAPCTHSLQGHSAVVTCVVLHPIFTQVVSGGEDSAIKIWDHESGEYMKTLKGHTRTVHALAFTPTGSHLASASADLCIKVWDYSNHTCIRTLRGHEHVVSAIRFLPSWKELDKPSNTTLTRRDNNVSSSGLDVNTTGSSFLISSSRDNSVKFWALENWYCEHSMSDHTDWIRCLATRNDGGVLATAGSDKLIFIYTIPPDAIRKTKKVATLRGHEHVIEALSFTCLPWSTSGYAKQQDETASWNHLVSGARDKSVRLWNITTEECLGVFTHHENWVRSVLLHPSGNYIISAGDDRTIRVVDLQVR